MPAFEVDLIHAIEPAFAEAARSGARAVLIVSDSATITHRAQLGAAGLKYRLPMMFSNKAYLEGGGLMSYGPDIFEAFRHAATWTKSSRAPSQPISRLNSRRGSNWLSTSRPPRRSA